MDGSIAQPDGMAVRLCGLAKRYGRVDAVRGIDIDIAAGEVVALLGPVGAGKSTTIDMLLGLTRPDLGEVRATWLAVIPFAVLGLAIGAATDPAAAQPMFWLGYLALSLFGGILIPVERMPLVMADLPTRCPRTGSARSPAAPWAPVAWTWPRWRPSPAGPCCCPS
jgi:hypothetical protein